MMSYNLGVVFLFMSTKLKIVSFFVDTLLWVVSQQLIQFVEHAHSKDDNIFYFSNGIQSKNLEQPEFAKARLAITYSILDELKIISK
jgi:hypothetical protein